MNIKFLIFAPPYNENAGGQIALHKLCDLINRLGWSAFLVPMFSNNQISVINWAVALKQTMGQLAYYENLLKNPDTLYPRNQSYNTPLYQGSLLDISKMNGCVVVYPEITLGNPLNGKHIARWILHNSGFHTGLVSACKGEVQFCYNEIFETVGSPYVEKAPFNLYVQDVPWNLYEMTDKNKERSGTAYAVRKGKGRTLIHDLTNSICIDGKTHKEVSEIFKRVKTFISYDSETFFSALAVISGAESVVIPFDNDHANKFRNLELTKRKPSAR